MARGMKKPKGEPPPDYLKMDLFAPGMTALHRAGLGGLACTLKYIERARRDGTLRDDEIPGAPWREDLPPWEIGRQSVTLRFDQPSCAGEFLQRLFAIAFATRAGLIRLPGQYGTTEPPRTVLAELQNALVLTFLQHGRVRLLAKQETVLSYDPEGTGSAEVLMSFKACTKYKHQDLWKDFVDAKGCLRRTPVEVIGPLNPGATVRHVAFTSATKIVGLPERTMPLCFAMVGCLTLSVNRGVGLLIVPHVEDLEEFLYDRPAITPVSPRECRVTSASDAVLQTQLRLRARRSIRATAIPACTGIRFSPTPWASQQKSRTALVTVEAGDDRILDLFEQALQLLPPRVASREVSKGRGKAKTVRTEHFWADSRIRPLIAGNLASGRPWFTSFATLMSSPDKARKTSFEREGLHAMIDETAWDDCGAESLVTAVHEAIRHRFGRIADESRDQPAAMKNRWGREYERWRIAFAGAKTADQFRHSLADLWSRAGNNAVLKESWRTVLPMLQEGNWKLARDLALLGLASYAGKESAEMQVTESDTESQQEG